MDASALAAYIDHTLLDPAATENDLFQLCHDAQAQGFAAVCVLPSRVALAAKALRDTGVKVCAVVSFPLGAQPTAIKVEEAIRAIDDGAEELDLVLHLGDVKDGRWDLVEREVEAVRAAAADVVLKVILETGQLTEGEKVLLARLCDRAGVDFLKTSTGMGPGGGATVEDVALLARETQGRMGIKASGGIRDRDQALALIEAGATRLGTSQGLALVGAVSMGIRPAY